MKVVPYGGPTGKLFGCASRSRQGMRRALLWWSWGITLHPAHREKGLMTVAAVAALKWAKEVFAVRRVYVRCV